MKFIRNLLIVLILAGLACGGTLMFYYSNDYRYSYTDISVNEPAAYSKDNEDFAELFKRVMKNSDGSGREMKLVVDLDKLFNAGVGSGLVLNLLVVKGLGVGIG